MDRIRFPNKSQARVTAFEGFPDLARQTKSYLTEGVVALSGGSTFAALLPQWLLLRPDVSATSFFPVDERMVPFNHAQSTWGNTYSDFLSPLGNESDRAHWPSSVDSYKEILRARFGNVVPVFDVVFLGVGDDGHTASLFPGGNYLDDLDSIVLQTQSPKPPPDRITLAPRVLISAKKLVVVVSGAGMRNVMKRIQKAEKSLPIVKILTLRQESHLFVERYVLDSL